MKTVTVVKHKNGSVLGIFDSKETAVKSLKLTYSALQPKVTLQRLSATVEYIKDGEKHSDMFVVSDVEVFTTAQHL